MDISILYKVATVALSVTVLALHAEGWVFEFQQRENAVVNTGSGRIGNRCECRETSKMTTINGFPAKERSLLHGHECRA